MDITNTVSLVTGASSGIGESLARELVAAGGRVVLVARRADRLEALAADLGDAAVAVAGDVTDAATLATAVDAATARWDRLDILVNNAGYGVFGTIESLDPAEVEANWRTNVLGPLLATQAALPALRASRGLVVNMSSVVGILASPGWFAYGSTKAALNHFSATLRNEVKDDGIRVLNVFPGMTATEFFDSTRFMADDDLSARWRDPKIDRTPADVAKEVLEAIRQDLENWEVPPRDQFRVPPQLRVP